MKRSAIATLAVIAFFAASTAYADCNCKVAKMDDGWCKDCNVGYVTGVKMKSQKLFDALQGKEIDDASAIKCAPCKAGLENNGDCEHCKVSFAHGKAYHSKSASCLARGKVVAVADMKCEGCKKNVGGHGWCASCKAGVVGNHAFKDKAAFKEAMMGREIIERAAKTAEKCEGCAVAMATDAECSGCKVAFKNGKPAMKKPVTP